MCPPATASTRMWANMPPMPYTPHPLERQTVQWLAYAPITSGGCSNEVEIRTGRVFLVKEDYHMGLVAHIKPTNAFDANSKVLVPVEELEILS